MSAPRPLRALRLWWSWRRLAWTVSAWKEWRISVTHLPEEETMTAAATDAVYEWDEDRTA